MKINELNDASWHTLRCLKCKGHFMITASDICLRDSCFVGCPYCDNKKIRAFWEHDDVMERIEQEHQKHLEKEKEK